MDQLKQLRMMHVSALMNRDVATIRGSETVAVAIAEMKKHKVTSLIVEPRNEDDTYGIITEKDIIEKVIDPGEDVHKDPWNTQVHVVMSKPCVTINPEMPVKYAIRLMHNVGVRRLMVTQDNKMIGMISQSEILHAVENLGGDDEHLAL